MKQAAFVKTGEAPVSSFADFCEGTRDPNAYVMAFNVAASKVRKRYGHPGSCAIDCIRAFDLAETERMHLGQINLLEVSSFCGPMGLIRGYDVVRPEGLGSQALFSVADGAGNEVPVYDGDPLVRAAGALFGSTRSRRFPLMPGTLCPAAYKSVAGEGPGAYYAALGLGIADRSKREACILMEDVGTISAGAGDRAAVRRGILKDVASSVLDIARNQGSACAEVYVIQAEVDLEENEVGCAAAIAPYIAIAGRAVPVGGFERLRSMTLEEWVRACPSPTNSSIS